MLFFRRRRRRMNLSRIINMFYTKNLRENEDIVLIIKKHSLAYIINYVVCFILFFIPFFFLPLLFDKGILGKIIFFILVIIASFYFLRLLAFIYFNCLVVTSRRVINFGYQKLFTKKVIELDLEDINDVSHILKGILANLFDVGSLEIVWKISDQEKLLTTKFVKNPAKIQRIILDLIKLNIKDNLKNDNTREIRKQSNQEILAKIKNEVGYNNLLKLVKSLEDKEEDEDESDGVDE